MQVVRFFLFGTWSIIAIGFPQQENPYPNSYELDSIFSDPNPDLSTGSIAANVPNNFDDAQC